MNLDPEREGRGQYQGRGGRESSLLRYITLIVAVHLYLWVLEKRMIFFGKLLE
jgi:hypothetical protein